MHSLSRFPQLRTTTSSFQIIIFSVVISASVYAIVSWNNRSVWKKTNAKKKNQGWNWRTSAGRQIPDDGTTQAVNGIPGCVGNTPLLRINSLSEATGCEILGKAEFLNPGGSVKDRVALQILDEAFEAGWLQKGGLITEGSAGSTGISLALMAAARGCRCFVALPDDAASEKAEIMQALGAQVEKVRPVSITHQDHFVHVAKRKAAEEQAAWEKSAGGSSTAGLPTSREGTEGGHGGGYFADQFENLANFRAHYSGTGREIWEQTGGKLTAFVAAAGTGGTLAGVSCYLKDQNPGVQCFLIDPPGSGLYNKVTRGVMYTRQEAEGKRLRNPFDTITEGIGINRLTKNFEAARVDGAFQGTDREAVEMARYLLREDGLFVGSSAAMNCVGAVRAARLIGPGSVIVTILCDGGNRHLTKFHNPQYLATHGLTPEATGLEFLDGKNESEVAQASPSAPATVGL